MSNGNDNPAAVAVQADSQAAAREYEKRGWRVLPVKARSKRPRHANWQRGIRTARDVDPAGNVGVLLGEPSNGLVDVDLDTPEARELAREFLPLTDARFGRASSPESHWLYRVRDPGKTRKLAGGVELRSTGGQTVFPPSLHPSGERVEWGICGEPGEVTWADLLRACEDLATAVAGKEPEPERPKPTPEKRTTPPPRKSTARDTKYAEAALRGELEKVATTPEGARNNTLNIAAVKLGHYVGAGLLDETEVAAALLDAARRAGLGDAEARATIRSGISTGKTEPKTPPAPAPPSPTPGGQRAERTPTVSFEPIPDYQSFPTEALPAAVGRYVDAAADAIGCAAAFVALPTLAAMGAAVGNARVVTLKRGWAEPAVVWSAIVGESGSHKTPALQAATAALQSHQTRAFAEHAEAMEEYKAALAAYEGLPKAQKSRTEKPEVPISTRYIVADATAEALAARLADNPRGLLMRRDELAGWLGGFGAYKKGAARADASLWLEVFNAGPVTIDRKTGDKPVIHIPRAAVSICGGIQPGVLSRALGDEHLEDGLAARLLLAMPPDRPRRWTEAEIPARVEAAFADVFGHLMGLNLALDENDVPLPAEVTLSPDAKARFVDFVNRHGHELHHLAGPIRAAYSKLEAYAARLALLFHCAGQPPDCYELTAEDVERAVAVVEWGKAEAARVYAMLDESAEEREARELVTFIERRGGSVTARDLQRGPRAFRGSADVADQALAGLAEAGFGVFEDVEPTATGGRPTRVFHLKNQNRR
jgi:hypothetical protein